MNREGVSVCITAYKTQDYIKECLDSVVNQTWFKDNDNFEIIVGIDGCEQTLEYLKTIMHNYKNLKVWMMDSNKGTYITSNTIMSNAKYENIFRFDSDDIMCSNLIEEVMTHKDRCKLVRYYYKNFGSEKKATGCAHGTIYVKKSTFVKYGGFRPWPCSADTEIYYRLKNLEPIKNIRQILMLRRVHETSLTHAKDTGMKSELRQKYKDFISNMSISKYSDAIINMTTNTYTEIYSSENNKKQEEYTDTLKSITVSTPERISTHKTKKAMVISTLRKDISSGKLIRVPVTGGYAWKRIK